MTTTGHIADQYWFVFLRLCDVLSSPIYEASQYAHVPLNLNLGAWGGYPYVVGVAIVFYICSGVRNLH